MSAPAELLPERHAEPEELVAYRARVLGEEETERLRDHLALCSECTELLLDLASFEEIEPRLGVVPVTPDLEMIESYEALMAKVEPQVPSRSALPDGEATEVETVYRALPWMRTVLPWAMAASLAVAVGLGIQGMRWRREAAALSDALKTAKAPKLEKNFSIFAWRDVVHGTTRGTEATGRAVLQVPLPTDIDRDRFASYDLEIRDLQGRRVQSFSDLVPNPQLTLALDRGFLDLGKYRFTLYGVRRVSGERQELSLPPPE